MSSNTVKIVRAKPFLETSTLPFDKRPDTLANHKLISSFFDEPYIRRANILQACRNAIDSAQISGGFSLNLQGKNGSANSNKRRNIRLQNSAVAPLIYFITCHKMVISKINYGSGADVKWTESSKSEHNKINQLGGRIK